MVDTDVTENITLSKVTGISKLTELQLILYPNPAKDIIYLKLEAGDLISIMDLSCRSVIKRNVNKGFVVITVAHLKTGSYVIKAETKENVIIDKLIIE